MKIKNIRMCVWVCAREDNKGHGKLQHEGPTKHSFPSFK